ncbi:Uncharacterised protein [uncultured archaeon]|nr:Uncharacterised protein [uncultured archaeon]
MVQTRSGRKPSGPVDPDLFADYLICRSMANQTIRSETLVSDDLDTYLTECPILIFPQILELDLLLGLEGS